jgi:outer membrane lipoprotein-sorting protein
MKTKNVPIILILLVGLCINSFSKEPNATQIIKKSDNYMQGKSNKSQIEMKIIRPTWERTIDVTSWTKDRDYSLTLINSPAKEKGKTFLKRINNMWQWDPTIKRMIKIPPAMMSQGWMGSDYSMDDMLKESSIVVDYTHKIIGEKSILNKACYKIELTPKEDAAVVWGKVVKYITKKEFMQIKSEYYDEDEELVKQDVATELKIFDGKLLPSILEILPADKEGHKTQIIFKTMKFNVKLKKSFFSQKNMKKRKIK